MDDLKINKDTTIGEIFPNLGDDEIVIAFRSQDKTIPQLLHYYSALCDSEGSPKQHLVWIGSMWQNVINWQRNNGDKVKVPD